MGTISWKCTCVCRWRADTVDCSSRCLCRPTHDCCQTVHQIVHSTESTRFRWSNLKDSSFSTLSLKRAEAKVAIRWPFRDRHHGIASIVRALCGTRKIWQQIMSFIPAPFGAGERLTHNLQAAPSLHRHCPVSPMQPNAPTF